MTVQLAPLAFQRFCDNNGNPLAAGQLWTYAAGTTTPQATYTDSTGTTPNPNPVPINARGEASVWLTPGQAYKFVLNDGFGNLIWTQDQVSGAVGSAALAATGTPSGASYIGFDGTTLDQILELRLNRVVDSIAALRALLHLIYSRAFVTGYYAPHDGGGGAYQYDPTDTTSTDNGGTIIVATDGGRWKLQIFGGVTPYQFGAKGDGSTSDDTPFNNALAWCASARVRLDIPQPASFYKITTGISSGGAITVRGSGMSNTPIRFFNNSNWTHTGGTLLTYPTNQFNLREVSLQSGDTLNTSTAILNISYSSGSNGSTVRAVTIEDVEVCGATLANGFNGGIRLYNATSLKVCRVRIANSNAPAVGYTTGSFGIKVDTDSQAGDWYIEQTNIYFCDSAINCNGQGTGQGFEGLNVQQCLLVANNIGVNVVSSVEHLFVRVGSCNINCIAIDIAVQNMMWVDIQENLLYAYDNGLTQTSWTAINFTMNDINHGLWSSNRICNNVMSGLTTTHATTRYGIAFQNDPNGLITQTLIDANSFANLEYGLVLFTGNNNITFTDANVMDSVATPISDSSGQTNNIFAFGTAGSPGSRRDNFGIEEKWAANAAVPLTGGSGSVTFPQPFKNGCDSVIAINGNPAGSFGNAVVSVVNSSVSASGFGISVEGATTGTITINYIAKGH
jgi:hypothetical protein